MTGALAMAAVLTTGAVAQKTALSDAQVEANVLRAMAADTRLADQPIQSTTAFGTVTLTGAVANDTLRDAAEKIASHTEGVKKVVDQLAVGSSAVAAAQQQPAQNQNAQGQPAQNDPNYDPASQNVLPGGQQADTDAGVNAAPNGTSQQPSQQPMYSQGNAAPQAQNNYPPQQGYPQQQQQGYPQQQSQYPQQGQYPQQQGQYPLPTLPQSGGYNQGYGQPAPRLYRRDYERQQAQGYQQPYGAPQGQPGGQQVTLAPGVVLPVRITRWLSSGDAAPGSTFTAVVENDILTNGLIAIPRGAEVQGTVVDAKGAGALKGRGSLTLQLNSLMLAGRVFPLQSDFFTVNGHDKAAQSVNSTIGGAALGVIIGAVAGGGAGAAIGAGVGGAAGLGVSAASGGGNAHLPAEALLQFRLTAPTTLLTASEAEMQRLGNYAGPEGSRRPLPHPPGYVYPAPYPYVGYYGRPYPRYYRGYYGY